MALAARRALPRVHDTHTKGERGRFLEFSNSILKDNKPAGLITRLNVDGTPVVSPMSDLSGVKVVDVRGRHRRRTASPS